MKTVNYCACLVTLQKLRYQKYRLIYVCVCVYVSKFLQLKFQ